MNQIRLIPIKLNSLILTVLFSAPVAYTVADGSSEATTLKDNTFIMAANRPEDSSRYKFWNLVYTEIFRRLDINLEMTYFPMKRASTEADSGMVDGEVERIYDYAAAHPNLVRVEEFLSLDNINAYVAASSNIQGLNGWDSLTNTSYWVEYTRGSKIDRDNLTRVVDKERLSSITTALQGLKKLAANRIDVFVCSEPTAIPNLQDPKHGLQGRIRKAGLMESVSLYMYVHKRHEALAPRISKIIKALKAEGLVEQYWNTAFKIGEVKKVEEQKMKTWNN